MGQIQSSLSFCPQTIVEDELEAICNEVLQLLTEHLCKNVKGNGDETEVFYLKMCGMFQMNTTYVSNYRYLLPIICSFET